MRREKAERRNIPRPSVRLDTERQGFASTITSIYSHSGAAHVSGDNPGNAFFKKSLCKQEDCRKIDKNMFVSSKIFGKVNPTYNNSRGTETSS